MDKLERGSGNTVSYMYIPHACLLYTYIPQYPIHLHLHLTELDNAASAEPVCHASFTDCTLYVQVLSVRDAQSLLRDEEDLVIAVYDYWLAKRLRLGRALIPAVRHERRDGTSSSNPYLAFRKRTEKMQTRKVSIVVLTLALGFVE